MAEVTQPEFDASVAQGEALMAGPRATRVWFDAFRHRIVVILSTGIEVGFDPREAQGLGGGTAAELADVQIDALGLAIHFPSLDADFYVPGLLAGCLGNEKWMRALAQRRAELSRAGPSKKAIRRPERAVSDLRRLRSKMFPSSRAIAS